MLSLQSRRFTPRLYAALAFVSASACAGTGGAPGPAEPPGPVPQAHPAPLVPKGRTDDLAKAKVFDERGEPSPCGPPQQACAPLPVSNDFLDHCRLAGFQVRQCGCEARCSGNVAAIMRHYDADGRPKDCAPARADCTPPQAGAAFQDACTEHGYRLDVCGCEWLCSGNFKR